MGIIYTCDADCSKINPEADKMITISSSNSSLSFYNPNTKQQLNNYHDLHFCCENCFISFFLEANKTREPSRNKNILER